MSKKQPPLSDFALRLPPSYITAFEELAAITDGKRFPPNYIAAVAAGDYEPTPRRLIAAVLQAYVDGSRPSPAIEYPSGERRAVYAAKLPPSLLADLRHIASCNYRPTANLAEYALAIYLKEHGLI